MKYFEGRFLFIILCFFIVYGIQAQDEKPQETDKEEEVESKVISIDEIPDETEKIGKRIIDLREILSPNIKISEVDSILKNIYVTVNLKKDSLLSQLRNLNRRELETRKIEWNNYFSILKKYQRLLKERTEDVSKINDELVEEISKWEETKESLNKNTKTGDVYSSLDAIIATLQEVIQLAHERLENVFLIQKDLTELILTMDGMLVEISLVEQEIQRDYFAFDSEPIWNINAVHAVVADSIQTETELTNQIVTSNFNENIEQLQEFLMVKKKILVFQIIFILLILSSLLFLKKRSEIASVDLNDRTESDAEIVLDHPIAATMVAGVLISAFFYDELIPIIEELFVFLIFSATVLLMPKLTNKKFFTFLLFLFATYLLQIYEAYIGNETLLRWAMIMEAILLVLGLLNGMKVVRKYPDDFKRMYKVFRIVAPFYIFLSGLAIVTNLIGMVGLSGFLIKGIVFSTILGIVVNLTLKVISSISIILFKLRSSYNIQTFTTMVQASNQRIQPILYWIGLIVWVYLTLRAFDLYHFLVEWGNNLLIIEWNIGEMTISLGGILAFTGIFIATMIIAKLIATIFQDDWMIKVLPRGVAPAISLLLRIILVSLGLYIGLTAAGLDLSKLGFVLGALGVGIGFGLQNVVLNFIAGLILAFERPINLGDTIEIDQEFGVVTSIGLRSSNIRTYSGSEAIIPNGDLISKKVINWTLKNRDRRSKILLKTSPNAEPEKAIELFNKIASEHPKTFSDPEPKTLFKSYGEDGNLQFELLYWTTFSDTLSTNHDIALKIFNALKEEGIQAPAPVRRIINEK